MNVSAKLKIINELVDRLSDPTMPLDRITAITEEMSDKEISLVEKHREVLGGDDRQGWGAIMMEAMTRGI